jgi:hypothetical protein
MRKIVLSCLILASIVVFGCAHRAPAPSSPALVVAPNQNSSVVELKDQLSVLKAKLAAYEALSNLQGLADRGETAGSLKDTKAVIEAASNDMNIAWNGTKDGHYFELMNRLRKLARVAMMHHVEYRLLRLRRFAAQNDSMSGNPTGDIAEAKEAIDLVEFYRDSSEDRLALTTDDFAVLASQARIGFAKTMVRRLQDCVAGKTPMRSSIVSDAEQAITDAFHAGDDVGALVTQLVKLRPIACAKDNVVCER